MSKQEHVEIGHATGLHYHAGRYGGRRPSGGGGGWWVPAAVLGAVALIAFGFVGWFAYLRTVPVEVNGETVQIREGATLTELLAGNDYFGVQPGRLMSVGGNVIDESGGDRCSVTRDGDEVPYDDLGSTPISEGASYEVADGADATEPSSTETVEVPPQVQMERGGAVQYVSQWGTTGKQKVQVGTVSGERVPGEVVEQGADMVVSSRNLAPKGGNYVALTFDDGPSCYTPQILDVLTSRDARATFFCLGAQAQRDPDGVRALVDAGMEVASHTMSHENLPKLDRDALRSEISSAFDALEAAGGSRPQMIRAPYGAFTDVEWARSGDLISASVLWNVDTLDWKRPGADAIVSGVLDHVKNGSIVLMHDGGGDRSQDVEALPRIIDGLRERGFELVTVSELMRLDGTVPEAVWKGAVSMPDGSAMPQA